MANLSRQALLITLTVFSTHSLAWAWGVGHDDSSWLAATVSPEPFASHPDLCLFAGYPDAMQDQAVGHDRDGYLRRLFTLEAIDALRAGDVPKGLFFASAATHYLTDRACIAHSAAWYHRPGDARKRLIPKRYESLQVPSETTEVYYEHLKGTAKDTVLRLPEPGYAAEVWRKYQGSTNAYFDSLPSVKQYVAPDLLRKPVGWTFTDFDEYARWYATFIALDMLDPASLGTPELRLRDPAGVKAVCVEELINGAAQDAAFYGYVATAINTLVEPNLGELLPANDKLLTLAEDDALVLIPEEVHWPVERAAQVLGMELLRAARRSATLKGGPQPDKTVVQFVRRVSADQLAEALAHRSAIILLPPDAEPYVQALRLGPLPQGNAGSIVARSAEPSHTHVILRGATEQETLYLVDYLLDLANAPLHGRWPVERALAIYRDVWVGWKLVLDLRGMSGQAAVDYARKLPYSHVASRDEDTRRYTEAFREGILGSASEEDWWQYFLLETPLPDGTRVPDMIQMGTDYTQLLERVRE
ncbi:MAG: hypothetical protein FJX75_09110 [Armatimonadetes bacterium]|nr:hypothetical protein [Armatimonadota bacterium]